MHLRFATAGMLAVLVWSGFLWAAENQPQTDGRAVEAAQVQFDKNFAEFKQQLGKLRALAVRFQLAAAADKAPIEAEFNQLVAETKTVAARVSDSAEVLYRATASENQDVGDFLFGVLAEAVHSDQYQEAARVAKLLVEGRYPDKRLANLAGIAAFCTNDYAVAKSELLKAAKAKSIDKTGESELQEVDRYAELWETEKKLRAAEQQADDLPRVKLTTTKGDIVVELFENEAPIATANFINLVEKNFYDGLKFHRVISGFMAQGGDPKGDGSGGPGYTIPCECYQANSRQHFAGTLSMAHAGRDSGGSQFFLTFAPTPQLNGKHTAFGRVIEGLDVLANLERSEPLRTGPPDEIVKATVLRKRDHKYEVDKRPSAGRE